MKSNSIKLVLCTTPILESILTSDESIANFLNINVIKGWSEFGSAIFEYVLKEIKLKPHDVEWMAYLPIHIGTNTLIGSCGFKGPPNEQGEVEIGYEVAQSYRRQGHATEIAQLLVGIAKQDNSVKSVLAHTLPEENASVKVLRKCGFTFIEEVNDPDDGQVWKWKLELK